MITCARIPAVVKNRHFTALWASQTISTFGDALTTLTLILLITEQTHSVAAVGGLTVVIAVPSLIIGLASGVYVDRWDRRRVMIVSDICRAALLAALALITLTVPSLPTLYLIAFLQASVGTFFTPARSALMQVVVPVDEQTRANALIQTTTVLGELTGTALAGVLVAVLHTYWGSFAIDAVTFALSAALVASIQHSTTMSVNDHRSVWASVSEGLRTVRSSATLRALLLVFSALTFALSPLAVLLAPYVVTTLHISTAWIGLIQAGDTGGNITGGIVVALAAKRVKPKALIIVGMFMLATLIACIAMATTVASLLVAYFVFGLLTVTIQTGIGALIQTEVDNAIMGRFVGVMSIAPGTVSVLAMAFCGSLGAVLGIRNIFLISGALLAVSTILTWHQFQRAAQQHRGLHDVEHRCSR